MCFQIDSARKKGHRNIEKGRGESTEDVRKHVKQKCSQANGVPVPREDSTADKQQGLADNGGSATIPGQRSDCKQSLSRVKWKKR